MENVSDIYASYLTYDFWSAIFRKPKQQAGYHVKVVQRFSFFKKTKQNKHIKFYKPRSHLIPSTRIFGKKDCFLRLNNSLREK